eukprot:4216589-Amphidinium_carterae.1
MQKRDPSQCRFGDFAEFSIACSWPIQPVCWRVVHSLLRTGLQILQPHHRQGAWGHPQAILGDPVEPPKPQNN